MGYDYDDAYDELFMNNDLGKIGFVFYTRLTKPLSRQWQPNFWTRN